MVPYLWGCRGILSGIIPTEFLCFLMIPSHRSQPSLPKLYCPLPVFLFYRVSEFQTLCNKLEDTNLTIPKSGRGSVLHEWIKASLFTYAKRNQNEFIILILQMIVKFNTWILCKNLKILSQLKCDIYWIIEDFWLGGIFGGCLF